jgi:hypothetical protein
MEAGYFMETLIFGEIALEKRYWELVDEFFDE